MLSKGLLLILAFALAQMGLSVPTLPPCIWEDSDNCIWNAQIVGNRVGRTFIAYRGEVYYLDQPERPATPEILPAIMGAVSVLQGFLASIPRESAWDALTHRGTLPRRPATL